MDTRFRPFASCAKLGAIRLHWTPNHLNCVSDLRVMSPEPSLPSMLLEHQRQVLASVKCRREARSGVVCNKGEKLANHWLRNTKPEKLVHENTRTTDGELLEYTREAAQGIGAAPPHSHERACKYVELLDAFKV